MTKGDRYFPGPVIGLPPIVAIAAGGDHFLALDQDQSVWAWGSNYYGQIGDGTGTNRGLPVKIEELPPIKAIAAGSSHSLAIDVDGFVWAWGNGQYGRLGNGSTSNSRVPVQVGLSVSEPFGDAVAIAAGYSHSLAVKQDGTVWAWGRNYFGEVGVGDNTDRNYSRPQQVHNSDGSGYLTGISGVVAGENFSLALSASGTVWAWGLNDTKQLGVATTDTCGSSYSRYDCSPRPVENGITGVKSIATGLDFSLALLDDGTVKGWSGNYYGQLGVDPMRCI